MKQSVLRSIGLLVLVSGCAGQSTSPTPAVLPPDAPSPSCISAVPGADAGVLRACTEREHQDAAAGRATNYEPFRSVVRALARADSEQAARASHARATAMVSGWHIHCGRFRAEAFVNCTARFTQPGLPNTIVGYVKGLDGRISGPYLNVGRLHDCPGYAQAVRVDRNPPVAIRRLARHDENLPGQSLLVRQMESGNELAVTSYEWPRCIPRSDVVPIPGFREAHAQLREAVRQARVD